MNPPVHELRAARPFPTFAWARGELRVWVGVLLVAAAPLAAANVPVFRFALERWPPQNYEAVIFHRGPFQDEEQELVDTLKDASSRAVANLAVASVDLLDPMEEPMQSMWNAQTNALSPWMVVRAPKSDESSPPVWSGPLKPETVAALLDSPARRKIAGGLLRGDSAVWVLLECGDAVRDEAAVDLLSAELKELEEKLPLPSPAPGDPPLLSPLPLRVAFSLVRVTRNDPVEGLFVNLLLHGEPVSQNKPIAFPVFGRGRALAPLAGRQLDERAIHDTCAFLAGGCSSEATESTAGKDLLLAADWNSIFAPPAVAEPKPLLPQALSPSADGPGQPPPAVVPSASPPTSARGAAPRHVLPTGTVLTVILVVTIGLLARRFWRQGRP